MSDATDGMSGIGTKGPNCSTVFGWIDSADDAEMVVVDSVAVEIVSCEDDPNARGSVSSVIGFGTDAGLSFVSCKGVGGFGFSFFFSFFVSFALDSADGAFGGSSLGTTISGVDSSTGMDGGSFFTGSGFGSTFAGGLISSFVSVIFFLRPRLAAAGISMEDSPAVNLSANSKSIFGISKTTSLVSMPLTAAIAARADLEGLFSAVLVLQLSPPLLRDRFGGLSGDLSNSGDGMSYGTIIPSLLYLVRDFLGAFGRITFSGPESSDLSHSEHCQPYSFDFFGCLVRGGFKQPR